MAEIKTHVIAKDGQALIGKAFHTLVDFTKNTFSTSLIPTFIEYIEKEIEEDKVILFYDADEIVALPINPTFDDVPLATCSLENSVFLSSVRDRANNKLTIKQLETFLFDIRAFWKGAECKDLYDFVRNFSMKKLVTFERIKDNAGNFAFTYSRKDEKGDVPPPPPITLSGIPVFDLHPDMMSDISFDVVIDYVQRDDSADVFFTLRSPFFKQAVTLARKDILERYLAKTKLPAFWGKGRIQNQTDGWEYQENGID